ncbi:MAG TPA: YetF domain-containing protein [Candidatus Limnocylindrales bacterium]
MLVPSIPVLELVLRTALVYLAFVLILRLTGKRQLGQFTIFDLALLLLATNALQPAMTGPDNSVGGGAVILVTIFTLNGLIAAARRRIPVWQRLFDNEPTVLARDGVWDQAAIDHEDLDDDDLGAALRGHGVEKVEETRLVVLEEDGSISVVPTSDDSGSHRRRRWRGRRPNQD